MSALECAIRAVCVHIGVDPNNWQAFEVIGRIALAALLEALPPELAGALRAELGAAAAQP